MDKKIVYAKRKTIAIQITREGDVLVKAPYGISSEEINRILEEKEEWIKKHQYNAKKRQEEISNIPKLTKTEIKELTDKARGVIAERVKYYAPIVGVTYERISIRCQKTRWGSCSAKGNLSFNCLLLLTPDTIINYVVVHELCHRKEMNHSKAFWSEVEKILPDYKDAQKWLKENGWKILLSYHEIQC